MWNLYKQITSILALLAWARSTNPKSSAIALAHIQKQHRQNLIVPIHKPKRQTP